MSVLRGHGAGFVNWQGIKCSMGGNQPRYNSEIFLVAARSTGLGVCGAGKLYGCQSSSHLLPGDSLGGVWVVEQPSTSLLFRHPRLQWLCKLMPVTSLDNVSGILAWQCIQDHIGRRSLTSLAQVYRCNFWMLFFKSPSPKRTSLWSSSSQIKRFWLGKLTKKIREDHKKQNPDFATVIKYVDKAGRKRYHGSKQLRSTQTLDSFKTE